MSIVIDLPRSAELQLEQAAARAGVDRAAMVTKFILQGLAHQAADAERGATSPERSPFPITWNSGGMLIEPTNAAINALLEEEDLENYFRVINQHAE